MPVKSMACRVGRLLRRDLGLGLVGGHPVHVLAGALGNVVPLGGPHVVLGLAGARVRARQIGAVVLAGLGDAVALLLGTFGRGSGGGEAHRDDGSQCGRDDETLVHGESPEEVGKRRKPTRRLSAAPRITYTARVSFLKARPARAA